MALAVPRRVFLSVLLGFFDRRTEREVQRDVQELEEREKNRTTNGYVSLPFLSFQLE
jgi:hypothetical protein